MLPSAVYEVNTGLWLREVSDRVGRRVTLADVPAAEWDAVVPAGVDCVWLMGVWERSPTGRAIALADEGNRRSFDDALPGWTEPDVLGSPYCIRDYVCASVFGGPTALAAARTELADRGARLLVDLVPNHLALDHPLVHERPEAFVHGGVADLAAHPQEYVDVGPPGQPLVVANGRDPYYPPWRDVAQLNAFSPAAREYLTDTLLQIARQADGVRCDMAMLLLDDVFGATWGERAGPPLLVPLWVEVLDAVRAAHPGFALLAEAYWGREPDLLAQGFDACYDKALYDRFVGGLAQDVRGHLAAMTASNAQTVRFLENHDEPRAAATLLPREREMAASIAVATLPGVTLWHEGQLDGRRTRLPVFLTRRPDEAPDEALRESLARLLTAAPKLRDPGRTAVAQWQLLDVEGWPDNPSHDRLLAWSWSSGEEAATPDPWSLVVVNYSQEPAQGLVRLTGQVDGRRWQLTDVLDGSTYARDGRDLAVHGFFVDLRAWGHHVLLATPAGTPTGVRESHRT